jgi:cardiolipin synthase (CMP-forming)
MVLLNPANLVTLSRLVFAPFIGHAILHGRPLEAFVLLVIAGFTDVIDGGLARRYGWSTAAGAYIDPIADKVLLSTVYICLAFHGGVPWWFVAVIFGRDLLIVASSVLALVFTRIRKFAPSVWGKFSTFLQIVTAGFLMGRNAFPTLSLDNICRGLIWLAAAATVWSGIHYGWRGVRMIRTH